jgi:hypothetical protein
MTPQDMKPERQRPLQVADVVSSCHSGIGGVESRNLSGRFAEFSSLTERRRERQHGVTAEARQVRAQPSCRCALLRKSSGPSRHTARRK